MPFAHLLGNFQQKQFLIKIAHTNQVPPVLLFSGPSGIGKVRFAKAFAKMLTKTLEIEDHPDIYFLKPEEKSGQYSLEKIKELLQEAALPPFSSCCKVFILEEAHQMQPYASNALLKTLEEPHPHTFFILTSSDPSKLISTILSRCTKLSFLPIGEQEIADFLEKQGVSPEDAQKKAFLSEGSLSKALLPSCSVSVKTLFSTTDYSTLLSYFSQIEKELEESKSEERVTLFFEEILYFLREHRPLMLERALKEIIYIQDALHVHVKIKTALEQLFYIIK